MLLSVNGNFHYFLNLQHVNDINLINDIQNIYKINLMKPLIIITSKNSKKN